MPDETLGVLGDEPARCRHFLQRFKTYVGDRKGPEQDNNRRKPWMCDKLISPR